VADVVDTDLLVTGEQRTGTFFALTELTQKFVPTIAMVFVFPLLQWAGFDPASKTNSPESIAALRYMFGLIPPVPMILTAILLYTSRSGRKSMKTCGGASPNATPGRKDEFGRDRSGRR